MAASTQAPLTVNWYHKAEYLQPVITAFTKQTGIPVKVTDAYDTFDTDVILVSDYKGLTEAKKFNKFQRIQSPEFDAIVPPRWRDRDGQWYGVVLRTRAVIYNKAQVKPGEIKTLQDLANPKWRGRVALRSAANVYNRSLLASMIVHQGHDSALEWARSVKANAGDPTEYSGDTGNIWRVAKGEAALSFVNTYYLGYVIARGEEAKQGIKLADTVGIAWLDQEGAGQPVNVTGVGLAAGTERKEEGLKLVRFLLSRQGQALLSENVFKYPVRGDVEPSAFLKGHGSFVKDEMNLNDLELHYDEADAIYRAVGWQAWSE
ncbi:extracellular solute-binding protein [Steroidobacter sp.]|uniref:extracellular solute-binding protein n=1 Tax=Steroidobacter sp. TaxID=1978227 RepID=UPI0025D48E6A|nr:extracellular solute-binding protein [Steroidobacter sp.]